jgi:hypothetical protein
MTEAERKELVGAVAEGLLLAKERLYEEDEREARLEFYKRLDENLGDFDREDNWERDEATGKIGIRDSKLNEAIMYVQQCLSRKMAGEPESAKGGQEG